MSYIIKENDDDDDDDNFSIMSQNCVLDTEELE